MDRHRKAKLMVSRSKGSTRFWRTLLSVAVAYAVAIQSVLIGVAGFSMPADADQNAFELCLHDASGAPELPSSKPALSDCTHCIFCFAGDLDAVIGTAPAVFVRVNVAMVVVPWLGGPSGPRLLARYTIASPRGPPVSA